MLHIDNISTKYYQNKALLIQPEYTYLTGGPLPIELGGHAPPPSFRENQ